MDFSTPLRSLESLGRRQPRLPDAVVSLSKQLLALHSSGDDDGPLSLEYSSLVLQMIDVGVDPNNGSRWEALAVGLNLANDFLERLCKANADAETKTYFEGPRVPTLSDPSSTSENRGNGNGTTSTGSDQRAVDEPAMNVSDAVHLCSSLLTTCRKNLEHNEPRVRSLVAKTVGSHARYNVSLKADNAQTETAKEELSRQRHSIFELIVSSLHNQIRLGRDTSGQKSKDSTGALDDTTGWRAVETNLQTIAAYINGCGGTYVLEDEQDGNGSVGSSTFHGEGEGTLLGALRYCSVTHVNRHVRAAGVQVLEQLIASVVSASTTSSQIGATFMEMINASSSALRIVVVDVLKTTLQDNWSQVRMAGSVLNRVFLVAILEHSPSVEVCQDSLHQLYPILLPRMCLNRFYLAQGVKLYSHETWRLVFSGGDGLQRVTENAAAVCRYYVKMCDADNHAVREAACQAVAELAFKIGSHPTYAEYLSPYISMLLQALLMCFHDESWPVRDEACLACGIFCRAYPDECRPDLKVLFERWTEQLTDQIWSVRENAAVALGDAIVAYGQSMFDEVIIVLKKNLPAARDQPAMTREEYKRRQNDIEAHTDSQLYSCGSLAPKLRKGGAGRIGCCNGAITREKAPWEASDGCIYLLRELCVRCTGAGEAVETGVVLTDEVLLPLMTELADVCRVRHFPQSDDLRATLWRQLPVMANALGKNRFKRQCLHIFIDLLVANLDADRSGSGASQLSIHAAAQCAEELARLVGVSIFRGRLEEDWQKEAFDRAMEDRKRSANIGPPAEQGFSPFGPAGLIPDAGIAKLPSAGGNSSTNRTPPSKVATLQLSGFEESLSL